jgi:hypothetical protein
MHNVAIVVADALKLQEHLQCRWGKIGHMSGRGWGARTRKGGALASPVTHTAGFGRMSGCQRSFISAAATTR